MSCIDSQLEGDICKETSAETTLLARLQKNMVSTVVGVPLYGSPPSIICLLFSQM